RRVCRKAWTLPISPPASMTGPNTFRFLAVEHCCEDARDWNPGDRAVLWNYNLHYFDDLNAVSAATRADWHRALVERWIRQNPAGKGVGWEAYPLSRRLVNWIK